MLGSTETLRLLGKTQYYARRMDPYLKVMLGGHTERTKTHNDGGKNPQWNDVGVANNRLSLSIRSTKRRSSLSAGIRTQAQRMTWSALLTTILEMSSSRRSAMSG